VTETIAALHYKTRCHHAISICDFGPSIRLSTRHLVVFCLNERT